MCFPSAAVAPPCGIAGKLTALLNRRQMQSEWKSRPQSRLTLTTNLLEMQYNYVYNYECKCKCIKEVLAYQKMNAYQLMVVLVL